MVLGAKCAGLSILTPSNLVLARCSEWSVLNSVAGDVFRIAHSSSCLLGVNIGAHWPPPYSPSAIFKILCPVFLPSFLYTWINHLSLVTLNLLLPVIPPKVLASSSSSASCLFVSTTISKHYVIPLPVPPLTVLPTHIVPPVAGKTNIATKLNTAVLKFFKEVLWKNQSKDLAPLSGGLTLDKACRTSAVCNTTVRKQWPHPSEFLTMRGNREWKREKYYTSETSYSGILGNVF